MARSGFKLRSGNSTSGSSFKMMGSSPVKKPGGYITNAEGERENLQGDVIKEGLRIEKTNQNKKNFNIKTNQKEYDQIHSNMIDAVNSGDDDARDALHAQLQDIEKGKFKGGKKLINITYTNTGSDHATQRKNLARGTKVTSQGKFPVSAVGVGDDVSFEN